MANTFTADATCAGMTLSMPRTEDGTVVTTRLDGAVVRTDTVTTFGLPVVFTLASPDQTRQHTWSVTIDATWSADQTWSETVPACAAGTTPPVPSLEHDIPATLPPAPVVPATTVGPTFPCRRVPPWSPSLARRSPPSPSSCRATGGDTSGTLAIGAALVAAGSAAALIARRRAS